MKKRIVVLSGAGISAESGLSTFRDSNGLWENHSIYEVATPEAWESNPTLVQRFYNERRKQLFEVKPNQGHFGLVDLENEFDVAIITQNVDDLHERAGSSQILHLHGELTKSRSTTNSKLVYEVEGWELKLGDTCENGSQLRPHIVWFGEDVPMFPKAIKVVEQADILIIVGTSLNVYPAASLADFIPSKTPIYIVDPKLVGNALEGKVIHIQKNATEGIPELVRLLSCT